MFVYLLIAAELGVLYTVFWYLYIREPHNNHRISGDLWGTYEDSPSAKQIDPALPSAPHSEDCCASCDGECRQQEEYVLDEVTNRYVRAQEARGFLHRMATTVDRTLSKLNVKP